MWVRQGRKDVFGPVDSRSGSRTYPTRTGWKRIHLRNRHHYSTLYNVRMPYAQFFDGGQAFHGVDYPLDLPPGSHGCVNLSEADAEELWKVLRLQGSSGHLGPQAPQLTLGRNRSPDRTLYVQAAARRLSCRRDNRRPEECSDAP